MAQPLPRLEPSEFTLRALSAAVIFPLAISAIWFGGWAFLLMILLISAAVAWELSRLCQAAPGLLVIAIIALMLTTGLSMMGAFQEAIVCGVLGTLLIALLSRVSRSKAPVLLIIGFFYIMVALLSVVWLRLSTSGGLWLFLWMMAVVVSTDIGAYLVGRAIGGPKLAAWISPGKTWAGLLGGAFFAAVAGGLIVAMSGGDNYVRVVVIAGILAVVAQIGDLIESAFKRHVGVKDASNLIPGHGGALDRLDGFLTVAPVMAVMSSFAGGSPLEWL